MAVILARGGGGGGGGDGLVHVFNEGGRQMSGYIPGLNLIILTAMNIW